MRYAGGVLLMMAVACSGESTPDGGGGRDAAAPSDAGEGQEAGATDTGPSAADVDASAADAGATGADAGAGGGALTAGAFVARGPRRPVELVTFDDGSGAAVVLAHVREVQLFVEPAATLADVAAIARMTAGDVIAAVPSLGYYLVEVPEAAEGDLIDAARASALVRDAFPNVALAPAYVDLSDLVGADGALPTVPNLRAQVGMRTYLYVDDDFVDPGIDCGGYTLTHGAATTHVASRGLTSMGQGIHEGDVRPNDLAAAHAIALQDLTFNGTGRAIVNLSLQGAYEEMDGTPLPASVYRANERAFLREQALLLDGLRTSAPATFERTLFVVSAGNGVGNTGTSGLDLRAELAALRTELPQVFGASPHLLVVGGALADGSADTGFNHGDGMVYAPGRMVAVDANGCRTDGTSFSAPAVTNLLATVMDARPEATAGEVAGAFLRAYAAKGNRMPSKDEVLAQLRGPAGADAGVDAGMDAGTPPPIDGGAGDGGAPAYAVRPATQYAGMVGGCQGGQLTAAFTVTAPAGETWEIIGDGSTGVYPELTSTPAPTQGAGSGAVTVTITFGAQTPTPGFNCSQTSTFRFNDVFQIRFASGRAYQFAVEYDAIVVL